MKLVSAALLALFVALVPAAPTALASPIGAPSRGSAAPNGFDPPITWQAGLSPEAVAVGDVNNDQVPDIVATSLLNSVTVLLGQGGGDFAPPVVFELGRRPSSLALADFNGDGNLDIAAASYSHEGVMVMSGDGAGDFGDPLTIEVGPGTGELGSASPAALVAEDFNHDGAVDIATLNRNSGDVSVLTGNGEGQFSSPVNYPSGEAFGSLQTADFNDDGWTDLATSDPRNFIFLLNEEGAGFGNPLNITVAVSSSVIVAADFDSDGIEDDVVVATQDSATQPYELRAYLGERRGGHFPSSDSPLTEQSAALTSLAVGDTSGDGAPDLVAVYGTANKVVVFENTGDGQFAEQASYPITDNGKDAVLADLDGDSALDILVATGEGIQVFMGTVPAGASVPGSTSTPTSASGPSPILWLDPAERASDSQILPDMSGRRNDGTLYNFDDVEAAFGDGPPPVSRFITFDGVDDLVGTKTLMVAPRGFSIAVWFRTTTASGKVVGFHSSIDGASEDSDRHMYIDAEGVLRFGVQWDTENLHLTSLVSREPVTDGEWHFAIGTVQVVGSHAEVALFIDGVRQGQTEVDSILDYFGYWRLGGGDIGRWPDTPNAFFKGDIGEFMLYDIALTDSQVAILSGIAEPAPTAVPTTTAPPEESDPQPGVSISSNIDGETLTLDVTFSNVPDLDQSTVYVVREDGTEFLVGPGAAQLSWTGETVTGLYRVEARVASGGDGQTVLASSTVPVLAPIATPTEIGVAVGVGVAVAAAGSAAAASGFSAYDFIVGLLKRVVLEKMRKRTRRVDLKRLPSWIAAVLAIVLMAVFLTLARPGALEFRSFGEAFVVATTAAVMFRSFTLAGGILLAFITGQKPRYLLWLAGTASFAITGILLHAPFGYTGYMDRKPGNVNRDARFAVAGFSVMLTVAGVFLFVGSLTDLVFAETGITMVLGALAASMLPFPFMGGNALWKWKRPAGVASAIIGLTPYSLFMYGRLPLDTIYALGAVGFVAFAAIMIADRVIMKREEQQESAVLEPEMAAAAVSEADVPAILAEPAASTDTSAATLEEPEDEPAPAIAPIAPTAQVITPRSTATPAADSAATPDKSV